MGKAKKTSLDKKILQDKIAHMIHSGQADETILKDMPLQQLMEEVSIYHQELIFQNNELAQRGVELKESRIKYRELFDEAPVGYVVMDQDYIIQAANKLFCRYAQLAPGDIIGQKLISFIHPDSQGEFYFMMKELSKTGHTKITELELAAPDRQLTVHVSSNVLLQDGNRLIRCAFQDYTKQKQADKAVKQANQQLTAMHEEMVTLNETLAAANRSLVAEVGFRQQAQEAALRREKQYQATASLLTRSGEDLDGLVKSIIQNAILLVGAPAGYIVLLDGKGENFVLRYEIGTNYEIGKSQSVQLGLLGQVYRSGEMMLVEDYRYYEHRVDDPDFDHLTTYFAAPLIIQGKVQGALVANWRYEIHHVTDEDKEIYRQFAILASLALEKSYSGARISYQNQLLEQLTIATASLVEEQDLERALQNILHKASSFMGIPHGYIQLFESDGQSFTFKYGLGRFANRIGRTVQYNGKGVFSEVLRTGRLVMVDDYPNWPQRMVNEDTIGMTAVIQAPLRVDGKTIGTIGLVTYGEPMPTDKDKLNMLEQYATIASTAIRNLIAHQEINRLAHYDILTGLPNRVHLNTYLAEEMRKASRDKSAGAVLRIDLDDFKTVNDHYGHTYGDDVIVAIAQKIVSAAGEGTYVTRAGGDEFIVILPGADLTKITTTADRMIEAIGTECEVRGQRLRMTGSIGITLYPIDAITVEDILKNSDIAMHAAKGAGKNNWRFYKQSMLQTAYDQMVLTNSLRQALEKGELYLQYQPQIELPSREIIGFEALLRWNSKEHGMVPPTRFIPLAEQKGMIRRPIGEWVIKEACQFTRKLAEMGRTDMYVAVNVSPWQLAADDFVQFLSKSMDEAEVAPGQLEVEITESALIESLDDSIDKLNQLSALGIRLSLDDFGTGYSSLTHLRNLPVGTIKIDKSFIDKMIENEEEESFIKSIIDMAHVRKLIVVAEGVETEVQLDKLGKLGCDSIQGYVFSRPVGEEEALNMAAASATC